MEPLFRGKSISDKSWVYGQVHLYGDGVFMCQSRLMNNGGRDWRVPAIEVDPKTICQYIGFNYDKTSFLYNGDLVQNYSGRICEIYWDEILKMFDTKPVANIAGTDNIGFSRFDVKVVGNKFDNPEIIKHL